MRRPATLLRPLLCLALGLALGLMPTGAAALAAFPAEEFDDTPANYGAVTLPAAAAAGQPGLTLESPSAVLVEAASGRVLFAKNPHERRYPASVTKIMTMVLVYEALKEGRVKLNDTVTVSEHAASMGGTQIWLEPGETFSVADLLKAVAVGSANDAAVALAEHLAGSHELFVQQMNAKAAELGMKNSQFRNATGLDHDEHFSTAYDLALLTRYAVSHYPEMLDLTRIYLDYVQGNRTQPAELLNRNKLVRYYPGADGLKTGYTSSALYSIAATAQRDGVRMIAVVMGSPSREVRNNEAAGLLNHGFANYTAIVIARAGERLGQVPVLRGVAARVTAVPRHTFAVTVRKSEQKRLKWTATLEPLLKAPVQAGDRVGRLIATLDGREVGRMDLVAEQAVARQTWLGSVTQYLGRLFSLQARQ